MSRRSRLAAALATAALVAGGCGGDERGALSWEQTPQVLDPPTAENDHVLRGVVRNDGDEAIEIDARDVALRADGGGRVAGTAVFLTGYVRPGESQNRGRVELSRQEKLRLGKAARIGPGETAPLVISWRARDGDPARVAYPGGSLAVPRR